MRLRQGDPQKELTDVTPRPQRLDVELGRAVEAETFRASVGRYASGITVITALDEGGEPVGFTCQSFTSVSLSPPLVSFGVMKTSSSYPRIRAVKRCAVNILSHSQRRISEQFARSGGDKWTGVDWKSTRRGNPVIQDSLMWLDCELYEEFTVGDHFMVIAEVHEVSAGQLPDEAPLLYFRGAYVALHRP